jgi:bacillithiol system protein YtxJ
MNWQHLENEIQLSEIRQKSFSTPQVIFKHSTRCSISIMVKSRLERSEAPAGVDFYYLDLLQYRPISNEIAASFDVHHESPQILVIKNGDCIFDESQHAIMMDEIVEVALGA